MRAHCTDRDLGAYSASIDAFRRGDLDRAGFARRRAGRVLDLLRGAPGDKDTADERARDDKPPDRTQDDIRDRMIRGR
jgi:hypothetical protein